ncbi:MAG TPA: MFS transporter [Solirubrobacteraceae bacterium]|nr:MFS transporter [Solirubrobacteraceae bacterium]
MTAGAGRAGQLLPALAVGLILADSSVVTLALPAILRDFDASVNGVAWVLISFNLALALVALPGAFMVGRDARPAFAVSTLLFAVACLACALAPSLDALIAARVAQGIFGAVAVASALALLTVSAGRERALTLWASAGVLGAAVGPAAGGVLTEALSWEAMFALQVPLALLTLAGARGEFRSAAAQKSPPGRGNRPAVLPLVALVLASAALSAALFLLVILLIEGWRQTPAVAALTVSVMPIAALRAGRWARGRHGLAPAVAGSLLVAGGLAALGLMPGAEPYWTFAPQLAIGAGLGLALATLIGASVAGASALAGPAAWTVAARHAGIVVGLLALTPIFTADLDTVRAPTERAGLARVLDAPLSLKAKIAVARRLDAEIAATGGQELPDIAAAFRGVEVDARERSALAALRADLEEELDRGATQAFSSSFLAAALLALLAAGAAFLGTAIARGSRSGAPSSNGSAVARLAVAVPAAAVVATLLAASYLALGGADLGPSAVADPCGERARPAGVERTQLAALATLDGAACKLGSSREDLLRMLLTNRRPPGGGEDELADAFIAGVERAQQEGALGTIEAAVLKLGLRARALTGILGLLLPGS